MSMYVLYVCKYFMYCVFIRMTHKVNINVLMYVYVCTYNVCMYVFMYVCMNQ